MKEYLMNEEKYSRQRLTPLPFFPQTKGAYVLFYIRKDCQETSDRSGIPASVSQADPEDDAELSNGALTNGQQSSSGDLSEDGDEMDTN